MVLAKTPTKADRACLECGCECLKSEIRGDKVFLKFKSPKSENGPAQGKQVGQSPKTPTHPPTTKKRRASERDDDQSATQKNSSKRIRSNINGLQLPDGTPVSSEDKKTLRGKKNPRALSISPLNKKNQFGKGNQKRAKSGQTENKKAQNNKEKSPDSDATEVAMEEASGSKEEIEAALEASSILLDIRYSNMPIKERRDLITIMREQYTSKCLEVFDNKGTRSKKRKHLDATTEEEEDTEPQPNKKIMLKLKLSLEAEA
ncbi:hypothetical protein TWF694_010941 [Orbilia ellipsospora]|uniref:Uncharacterized protein n=1 Tax=Orbilia ellipsospora TaxID=2528407 RepID=A0AAV9XA41_9PEZI